jgi:hypothetical protein
MAYYPAAAIYSEASGVGTMKVGIYPNSSSSWSSFTTDTLYYTSIVAATTSGGTTYSPTNWFISWEQNSSTAGYSNGVAPTIPSEIYVGGYLVAGKTGTTANVYDDTWNFILEPNGLWFLRCVRSIASTEGSTPDSNHPTELYMVGYDSVNNLTYTKQGIFLLA